ncbi:protein-disulfide reductase DsbD domain-containing protein [Granulicella tundricola]|uniref:Thiol:disulfide interchange protein DsbD N-terminal domain-containing protein n=1 Tax=Granulicella tundricola (strain ATCC BAA-1859 / DSM 23138 / MP5ACTX9) TaxID=1198114 RepID=E8WYF4_GRATM|nr:protein-disulfide reductase DsbD domain-containing protein [Granulicella tundricola]ADW69860.1 hypothetical protein AciX9_2837 [Granulicella tundricola MP5ACTX9]
MRKSLALFLLAAPAFAAPKPVVHWQVTNPPAKALKRGTKLNLTLTGQIDPGWHLYALEEPQGGPIATEINLAEGSPADLIRVEEQKPKIVPDPIYQLPTGFFEQSANFTLHLQLDKSASAHPIQILIRYQSCNDRVCLPPHTDTVDVPLTTN